MTTTPPDAARELQRPLGTPPLITRTPEEHAALRTLLLNAKRAETIARGSARRESFRRTRSLLAAARALGFTVPALAEMLSVRDYSIGTRSNVITLMPRALFAELIPDLTDTKPHPGTWGDQLEDPVQLLAAFLSLTFVADGGGIE